MWISAHAQLYYKSSFDEECEKAVSFIRLNLKEKIMKIIPKRNIIFITKDSKEEVLRKISESTQYQGTINSESFNIYRNIDYRNSFLPQIKGRFFDDYNATKIEITMQLHTFVLAFMSMWLALALLFCGIIISDIVKSGIPISNLGMFHLIPFGMLLFGFLLAYIPFTIECRISEKDLQSILDAEIIRK